jgi:hypothetical protein
MAKMTPDEWSELQEQLARMHKDSSRKQEETERSRVPDSPSGPLTLKVGMARVYNAGVLHPAR